MADGERRIGVESAWLNCVKDSFVVLRVRRIRPGVKHWAGQNAVSSSFMQMLRWTALLDGAGYYGR